MNINWRPKDEKLSIFIDAYIDSFASWDLALFVHYNPGAMDTVEGFATRLGRSVEEVTASLERFCRLGCFSQTGEGRVKVYSPTLSPELKEVLARFVHAQDDRELRLMLIRSILQKNKE